MLKYGEVTSLNEQTNRESREIELHGILQKRNRKGFYQNRYFRTSGVLLSYYTDQETFNKNPLFPNASFKFTDMRSVQINGSDGKFTVTFSIASLEIDLKAANEAHAIHWTSFIRAKINLYSVNMLLTMDDSTLGKSGPSLLFVTTTFRQLMLLKPSDQDTWNETSLNGHFETAFANRSMSRLPLDELCSVLLSASHKALDDFTFSCEECEVEFRTRNPRVIAHCREYMRRYAKLFCGRIILELSPVIGPSENVNLLAPVSALDILCFLQRIYLLNRFSFLPAVELCGVFDNLRSLDYMCGSYIYICRSGLQFWLSKVGQLQPRQQGEILADIPVEIESKVELIRPYKAKLQESTYFMLLSGSMSGMLLELREFLISFGFVDFSDEALCDHIVACYKIDQYSADICRLWAPPKVSSAVSTSSAFSGLINDSAGNDPKKSPSMQLLEISDACRRNAMRASGFCVRKLLPGVQDLMGMFFFEKGSSDEGWIGGRACKALLLRLGSWIESMRNSVPQEYLVLVKAEAYRFLVITYYSTFIGFYKSNKKAQLSHEGVEQVTMDLRLIEMWIAETGVCSEIEPLKEIIKKMRLYLTCEPVDLLVCFSGSVQDFASSCPNYAYDLFRVAMKLRDDIPADFRRRILGMCSEFMVQYKYVYEKTYGESIEKKVSDDFLSGGDYFSKRMSGESMLSELMPLIGLEHCTGKKWSLEKPPNMNSDENIFITNLVTEACHHIRMMRLARRSSITISAGRSNKVFVPPVVHTEGISRQASKSTVDKSSITSIGSNPVGHSTNPFNENSTNPFASDEDGDDAATHVCNSNVKLTATDVNEDSIDNKLEQVPKVLVATSGYKAPATPLSDHGPAPRLLKMDRVSYEGVECVVNPSDIQDSKNGISMHRTLRRKQVIFLQEDNFKDLHDSLKPIAFSLQPYSGPQIRARAEEKDASGSSSFLVNILEGSDDDEEESSFLERHCHRPADKTTRSVLIASYSAEYLLMASENSDFQHKLDIATDIQGLKLDFDTNKFIESELDHFQPTARPASIPRFEPVSLFIVPPDDSFPAGRSDTNILSDELNNDLSRLDSIEPGYYSTNDDIERMELQYSQQVEATAVPVDYPSVQYVVVYGPGTVIRTDISINSDKLCSVPFSRIVDVYESTAVESSEGITRVHASYRGIHGWTSFKARDGTTIIERCIPAEKSTLISRPQKPPKRRSFATSMEQKIMAPLPELNDIMIREGSIDSEISISAQSCATNKALGLQYELKCCKPPPKPPRKSVKSSLLSSPADCAIDSTSSSASVLGHITDTPSPPLPQLITSRNHAYLEEIPVDDSVVNAKGKNDDDSCLGLSEAFCETKAGQIKSLDLTVNREIAHVNIDNAGDAAKLSEIQNMMECDVNRCNENHPSDMAVQIESVADSLLSILENAADIHLNTNDHSIEGGNYPCGMTISSISHGCVAKPDKPPKKVLSLPNSSSSTSNVGSPSKNHKPEKPPKLNPSVPVALLYENESVAAVAVAVAVTLSTELEVIDPADIHRPTNEARREGPQRLNKANSVKKSEEKVDRNPSNPFDSDSDDDYNGATAAPGAVQCSSSTRLPSPCRLSEEGPNSTKQPKRRKSSITNRLSSFIHMGRSRHFGGESSTMSTASRAQSPTINSCNSSNDSTNPFADGAEN